MSSVLMGLRRARGRGIELLRLQSTKWGDGIKILCDPDILMGSVPL